MGNSLVVFVLIKFRQTRSSVNLFIGNMAVADLLSTIFLSWTGMTEAIFQNYPNGPFYCKYGDFFKNACLLASTFSLVVLSFDRLKKVIWPFRKTMTTRQTFVWCTVIWLIALGASAPHVAWRSLMTRKWLDYQEVWCSESNISSKESCSYWIALLALLCYIPIILLLAFYSILLCKMKKLRQKLSESVSSF